MRWATRAAPALTPAGRAIGRRSGAASVEDLLAGTAAGLALHLTFPHLLERLPHPGLRAVPVRGLPPYLTAVVRLRGTDGPTASAAPDDRSVALNGRAAERS
ncbi:hypothetical protein [Kitasatospora sp. NPDC047058]|uniref:hypothetical protein n=1 Tax=Kitasatospora sp. NPDC047058 TaxID=3155620 RepID=UPI0033F61CE0